MPQTAHQTFPFEEFEDTTPVEAPAPAAEVDVDAACAAAREDERQRLANSEIAQHNALLEQLKTQLADLRETQNTEIEQHKQVLLEAAAAAYTTLCNMTLDKFGDQAGSELLRAYLESSVNSCPAKLMISDQSSSAFRKDIGELLKSAGADEFVTLAVDTSLTADALRLTWDRGTLKFDPKEAQAVAKKIFAKAVSAAGKEKGA